VSTALSGIPVQAHGRSAENEELRIFEFVTIIIFCYYSRFAGSTTTDGLGPMIGPL
jgi:hypothetical protein